MGRKETGDGSVSPSCLLLSPPGSYQKFSEFRVLSYRQCLKIGEKHCRLTDKRVTIVLADLISVHVYPDCAGVSGIHAGIDPLDAVDTVVDVGIDEVVQGLFVAALLGVHGDCESLVEVGPGIDEAGVVAPSLSSSRASG